jgi:hypothetical protein
MSSIDPSPPSTARRVERHRALTHALDVLDLLDGVIERLGDLLRGRRAAELLGQFRFLLGEAPEEQLDVDREANGPGLIGEGARHRLPYPPHGVRGEARAAPGLEFLHRLEKTRGCLLR